MNWITHLFVSSSSLKPKTQFTMEPWWKWLSVWNLEIHAIIFSRLRCAAFYNWCCEKFVHHFVCVRIEMDYNIEITHYLVYFCFKWNTKDEVKYKKRCIAIKLWKFTITSKSSFEIIFRLVVLLTFKIKWERRSKEGIKNVYFKYFQLRLIFCQEKLMICFWK